MNRLQDLTETMGNPNAWIGAIFIAVILTVPTGLMDKLRETPRNTEVQQAADLEQAQREETIKADHVAKQISRCIEERGPGAAPVFDEQGFVVKCIQRRKS